MSQYEIASVFTEWADENDPQRRVEQGAEYGLAAKDVELLNEWFLLPKMPEQETVTDSGIYSGVNSG